LSRNGYSEKQVQAIFLKSSTAFPQCDLKLQHCVQSSPPSIPDAYVSEQYLGNILRYLKCCKLGPYGQPGNLPRYPNLKQVFVTGRIYGGYAKNPVVNGVELTVGCVHPEPFAYEESFGVQRLIVAQINRTPDAYTGNVRYPEDAPWVDWGPYLWASGPNISSSTGLFWCGGQAIAPCLGSYDFRHGDPIDPQYWGDFTHPSADGAKKVADQLVTFIGKTPNKPGSPFVTPWIGR
jgi:hypothetical protein